MSGSLMQLFTISSNPSNWTEQSRTVLDVVEMPIQVVGRTGYATIINSGDTVSKLFFKLKVAAAPPGYRWKRCWPYQFLRSFAIEIGGIRLWGVNSAMLQMNHLIRGESAEGVFDFDDDERTRRSSERHEIMFEPIRLRGVLKNELGIPIVALYSHEITVHMEFEDISRCLEAIPAAEPPAPFDRNMFNGENTVDMSLSGVFNLMEQGGERQNMTRLPHSIPIVQNNYDVQSVILYSTRTTVRIYGHAICPALYFWITDDDGNELPNTVVENIRIRLNGQDRFNLSGFESREQMRHLLPHWTVENIRSRNLYYVSFFSGRHAENEDENGINLQNLDACTAEFQFVRGFDTRILIHTVSRLVDRYEINLGMGHTHNNTFVPGTTVQRVGAPYQLNRIIPLPAATVPGYENPDQHIDISGDELCCIITHEPFTEGQSVYQCNQCHKRVGAEAMERWHGSCPNCRGPFGPTTFRKGKAHLPAVPTQAPS